MGYDIKSIAKHFNIDGELVDARPVARGHINDTYILTGEKEGRLRLIGWYFDIESGQVLDLDRESGAFRPIE